MVMWHYVLLSLLFMLLLILRRIFFFDQRGLGGVCLAPKSRRGMLGPLFF